jgi:hypothetical protein
MAGMASSQDLARLRSGGGSADDVLFLLLDDPNVGNLADHMPRAWSSEIQLMTTVLSASDPALPLPS